MSPLRFRRVGRRTQSARTVVIASNSAGLYGSDRVMLETARGFHSAGRRVVVLVPETGPLVDLLLEIPVEVGIVRTPVIRKSLLSPLRLPGFAADCARALLSHARLLRSLRADLVVVNTMTIPVWTAAARLTGADVVCHVHEAERSASRPIRWALAAPLTLADRVVANSDFSRQSYLASIPSLEGRSSVVYNAVAGPPAPSEPRAQLDGPVRLLFIGRLSERKGAMVAVEALAALRDAGVDARLSMAGAIFPGYEEFERRLHARIGDLGLDDAVDLLGFTSPVWPVIDRHDIVLVPSVVEESFGNTVIEATLARRPVVASGFSGLREAARELPTVHLCAPGDAGELATRVRDVIDDWQQVCAGLDRAAEVAARRHDRADFGARFVAVASGKVAA